MLDTPIETHVARRCTEIDAHIGGQIRAWRLLAKMSQEALGERLGLTFQQVQKYEKGVNRIGAARLLDVARVFSVDVSVFYAGLPNGADEEPVAGLPNEVAQIMTDREGVDLVRAILKAGPEHRRALLSVAQSLAATTKQRRAA